MKKLISLLLVLCILCPLLSGCVQDVLTDELKTKIIQDYLSWSGLKGDLSAEDVKCTFLGKFGNSVAVYFQSAGAYDVATEETVAEYRFTYPDSRVIRIWDNGKFYKISEAYDQRIIKKRHVESLYNKASSIIHGKPLFIWEEKVYCDYDIYRHPTYLIPDYTLSAYNLTIAIDTNLSSPNKIFDNEFYEHIEVSEIIDTSEYYNKKYQNDVYRQYFSITLSHPSSKENMRRIVEILEAKEGIQMVRPSEVGYGMSATTSYDSSNELSINWGLENIDVDKVWNFTTGSQFVCK